MRTQLHILCGLPCSGKTTLAKQLEQELPALRLGPDEWLIELLPDRDPAEVDRQRPILNAIQWKVAQQVLRLGTSVILEHGSWSPIERLNAINEFADSDIQVHLHYLKVPMDVLKTRLIRRNANLPDDCFFIRPENLDDWAPDFIPPDAAELELYDEFLIYEPSA